MKVKPEIIISLKCSVSDYAEGYLDREMDRRGYKLYTIEKIYREEDTVFMTIGSFKDWRDGERIKERGLQEVPNDQNGKGRV